MTAETVAITFATLPVVLTPGAYLTLRRKAAGLSIEDVAARITTEPVWGELARVAWLKLIECDAVPMGEHVIDALGSVFDFDPELLVRLDAIRLGSPWAAPDVCLACGCSDHDPCLPVDGKFQCAWSESNPSMCTVCAARQLRADEQGEAA